MGIDDRDPGISDGLLHESDVVIGITEALQKVLEQDPSLTNEVADRIQHDMREYTKAIKQVGKISAAWSFHKAADTQLEADRLKTPEPVSCQRGCAHCCFIEVHITPDEADLILAHMKDVGREVDWTRLEHQAKPERWRQLAYKDRQCVFLDGSNACSIYEFRPMNCRKYLVAGDPAKCNSERYPGGATSVMIANKVEVMASAIFSLRGTKTMPKQLIKRRDNERPADK